MKKTKVWVCPLVVWLTGVPVFVCVCVSVSVDMMRRRSSVWRCLFLSW